MTAGLIRREVIAGPDSRGLYTIRETWDLTVPGCPMVCFDLATMRRNESATWAVRTVDGAPLLADDCPAE